MGTKEIHENYHKKSKSQHKIISKNNFTYKIILPVLDKYITNTSQSVLDVGCGSGTLSLYLANKGNKVQGIDISEKAIETSINSARVLGLNNVSFKVIDFPNQNISSEKYDVILLLEVIEHIKDDEKTLKLLCSKLNRNGILILSTPSKNAPLHRIGLTKHFDRSVGHLRRYSKRELEVLIENSGFEIISLNKNEGVLRNFLFTQPIAGKFVRFIKYYLVNIFSTIDNLSMLILGESDYIVIARRPN